MTQIAEPQRRLTKKICKILYNDYETSGTEKIKVDDEGTLDDLRPYDIVFLVDGIEKSRIPCYCNGKEVPRELRRLRTENPNMVVTAVPNLTADEEFIEKYGIGIH